MSYSVTHWTRAMESDFPVGRFPDLLDELTAADLEHPGVAVTHESEWSLAVYRSGLVVLENLEGGDPRHKGPVGREECLALMAAVAEGRIDEVRAGVWRAGYPTAASG